jgi:hypothetical protein
VRFLEGAAKKFPFRESAQLVSSVVNGTPGLVVEEAGVVVQTIAFEVRNGRIEVMFVVRNPDKLSRNQRDLALG